MRIKRFIRWITPKPIWLFLLYLRVFFSFSYAKSLKKINFNKSKSKSIVLGNGPSLKADLEVIAEKKDEYDFICVNNFCSSPYFSVLKPTVYVFLDGYFYNELVHPDWEEQRNKTFKILNETTSWRMTILLPYYARKGYVESKLLNKNITIQYVKVISIDDKEYLKGTNFLFSSGYFGPEGINVLIYAVYYAIWAGYKNIEIYGADLSFHNDVDVDQKTNHLYMKFRHFNQNDKLELLRRGPRKEGYETMFYMLDGQARVFKAHELLECFSKRKNIKIYNKSSYSLIDAYERG